MSDKSAIQKRLSDLVRIVDETAELTTDLAADCLAYKPELCVELAQPTKLLTEAYKSLEAILVKEKKK